ncbi:ammonium transporter Rh type A-like [Huso huso]|uniref:Ammonium transporter Rh type A-like n=1 Tax=Huso huso TaxID=61971 RepID=A0ABR0YPB2_HUSHU
MAPKYAPSLRRLLPVLAICLEIAFILIFIFFVQYDDSYIQDETQSKKRKTVTTVYADFQDVHVMVFLGFGFLMSFLRRYGFSSTGFNLLVAALGVQWATLVNGFLFEFSDGKIRINMMSLVTANLCAASALISMGAVLGKTNPVQLLLMTLLEVTSFIFNHWFLTTFIKMDCVSSIMHHHVFGAYFGLMVSWALHRPGLRQSHEKEKSSTDMGKFSMLGTIFLWMFWPSYNSVLIEGKAEKMNAVYSTYFSLAASAVTVFAFSVLISKKGKMNMVYIHNATLAGGVAVGAAATVIPSPWIALTIGLTAGLICILGCWFMKPFLELSFDIHDTCGVHYVHGVPGILGVLIRIIIELATASNLQVAWSEAAFYLLALFITLALSLVLGLVTGFLLKLNIWKPDQKYFDDQAFWEFPHLAVKL